MVPRSCDVHGLEDRISRSRRCVSEASVVATALLYVGRRADIERHAGSERDIPDAAEWLIATELLPRHASDARP
jgi:hypothetical protein